MAIFKKGDILVPIHYNIKSAFGSHIVGRYTFECFEGVNYMRIRGADGMSKVVLLGDMRRTSNTEDYSLAF